MSGFTFKTLSRSTLLASLSLVLVSDLSKFTSTLFCQSLQLKLQARLETPESFDCSATGNECEPNYYDFEKFSSSNLMTMTTQNESGRKKDSVLENIQLKNRLADTHDDNQLIKGTKMQDMLGIWLCDIEISAGGGGRTPKYTKEKKNVIMKTVFDDSWVGNSNGENEVNMLRHLNSDVNYNPMDDGTSSNLLSSRNIINLYGWQQFVGAYQNDLITPNQKHNPHSTGKLQLGSILGREYLKVTAEEKNSDSILDSFYRIFIEAGENLMKIKPYGVIQHESKSKPFIGYSSWSELDVLWFLEEVASGLEWMHDVKEVVHNDFKLDNVVLVKNKLKTVDSDNIDINLEDNYTVKIIDFELSAAKPKQNDPTGSTKSVMTSDFPPLKAPELESSAKLKNFEKLNNRNPDDVWWGANDIWCLGMEVISLLTGETRTVEYAGVIQARRRTTDLVNRIKNENDEGASLDQKEFRKELEKRLLARKSSTNADGSTHISSANFKISDDLMNLLIRMLQLNPLHRIKAKEIKEEASKIRTRELKSESTNSNLSELPGPIIEPVDSKFKSSENLLERRGSKRKVPVLGERYNDDNINVQVQSDQDGPAEKRFKRFAELGG